MCYLVRWQLQITDKVSDVISLCIQSILAGTIVDYCSYHGSTELIYDSGIYLKEVAVEV